MTDRVESSQTRSTPDSARLHYLDWLRVLAIFAVFLFHAVHPFDLGEWHIKNAEQSQGLTMGLVFFSWWGMAFFFLVAGAGSWFALQRRTPGQYATERFKRLLIPFIFGTLLFRPLTTYLEWRNKVQRGVWDFSFQESLPLIKAEYLGLGFSPQWFGIGQHLWFLGFLFAFALITLPLFTWLRTERGQRVISWMGQLCQRRGTILLFVIPLIGVSLLFQPFFPDEHDWADFFLQMSFFVLGFVLFADQRITKGVRRDGWLMVATAIGALAILLGMLAVGDPFAWSEMPTIPQFYLVHGLVTVNAWCWTMFVVFLGMRFLDFSNSRLQYAREVALPFFVIHQPVIIVIAFFVVQWSIGIPLKMLTVIMCSLAVCFGLYELIIQRIRLLRALFGMKA
jgi:glucan biosynthesis protein C